MITDEKKFRVARIVHEINRLYCEGLGQYQPRWENTSDWQRDSTYQLIEKIIANPNIKNSECFEEWKKNKIEDGWRYGPKKDENKKTHPCIVDWENLPIQEREKDPILIHVIKGLLNLR